MEKFKIGYARVSTSRQNLDRQIKKLEEYGCDIIFTEKVSGKNIEDRTELKKMFSFLESISETKKYKEIEVVVDSMSRLGREVKGLDYSISKINSLGAAVNILNLKMMQGEDTFAKRIYNMFILEYEKMKAEDEREETLARQAEGIIIAKEKGKYTGRKTKYYKGADGADGLIYDRMVEMLKNGHSYTEIAKALKINRSTVYRNAKKLKLEGEL